MDIVKTCKTCLIEKPLGDYHKHKGCKYGVRNECKECRIYRQMTWQKNNREQYLDYQKAHYKNNKYYYRQLQIQNPKIKEHKKKDYKNNKNSYFLRALKRKKHIKIATPAWVNFNEIKKIYDKCKQGYHVDHIVPLRGDNVCGLHVHWNLQIITAKDNLMKGNKLWI